MSLASTHTVLRLIINVNSRRYANQPGPRESQVPLGSAGALASLFEPLGRPKRTLVLVHGVSGRGNRDPHIVNLARSLVPLGYRCVIPELHGFAQFRHDPRDIETLVQAIEASQQLDGHRIALMAFSYGASYALVAAADPRARDACAAMVGFGAYYDLGEALEHQRQWLLKSTDLAEDCADIAYLRYTLLSCHRHELGLSEQAWRDIEPILINYTTRVPLDTKRGPLLRHTKDIDYVALMQSYQRRDLSPRLSPATSLAHVRCHVGLLHDPNDRFVPAHHAERIRSALDARAHVTPTEVLLTPMLSHVQVDPMRRLFDLPRLVRLLEPALGYR